jgi:hypothetical protein
MNSAALVTGSVHHERVRPVAHAFEYPTFCVLLPMRRWAQEASAAALPRNRRGWLSFHDRDHGNGGADALQWAQSLLAEHGVSDADGEIWLQTYPRVLGYVFKPVSFWYCHRADGHLRAVIAEVNNTFGERHCYLLAEPGLDWGRTVQATKAFHVSPFFAVRGHYRFRFMRTADRLVARVDHHDDAGALLTTCISGRLAPLTRPAARAALLRMPLLTLGVMARIHWQALRLWLKHVPFHRKPEPPILDVTRQSATHPAGLGPEAPPAMAGATPAPPTPPNSPTPPERPTPQERLA